MFTLELDRLLIRHVKNSPGLYDYNDPKYMDFNAREVAWQKIGDAMKRPATDCKLRWINIRDVNRRVLRKRITNPESIKKYRYEKELAFMRPFYKDVIINGPDANVNGEQDNDTDEQEAIDDEDGYQNEESGELHQYSEDSETGSCEKKRKAKNNKTNKNKIFKKEFEIEYYPETSASSTQLQLDPDDPVDSFLLSIGSVLKNLSPRQLNLAKTKIFSVVQEHDLQNIIEQKRPGNESKEDQTT